MTRIVLAVVLALAGCSSSTVASNDAAIPSDVVDVRVPIPSASADFVDLVTPEAVVQPGEEKLFCYYDANPGGELAMDYIAGEQGLDGHHVALMTTTAASPPAIGSFVDCTAPADNVDLRWFTLQGNALPAGDARYVAANKPLVVQSHYINVGEYPILIRDVVRMHEVAMSSVTTWVTTTVATDVTFSIAADQPGSLQFQCTLSASRQLISMYGHMHEMGTSFGTTIGATSIYSVPTWLASYRDAPPFQTYYDAPVAVAAGTVVTTDCAWFNTTDQTVVYPTEMCFTFMDLAGSQDQATCDAM